MKLDVNQIKSKILPVLKEANVAHASLFGSYVRGEQREDSDVDMLVEIPRGTGLFGFVGLKHKLEKVLGKKVDLVTYKSIHPRLQDRILREQISIL